VKAFIWKVPAPEWGVGQYRYSETPVMDAAERASIEPPAAPPALSCSRWTGEPPIEAAGIAQSGGIGQSQ
jgi:hypothetical protein